jgi:hypothetical protein
LGKQERHEYDESLSTSSQSDQFLFEGKRGELKKKEKRREKFKPIPQPAVGGSPYSSE